MPTDLHIDAIVSTTHIAAQVIPNGIPFPGEQGDPGVVQSIVAGDGIEIDDTDPANPIVSISPSALLPDPTGKEGYMLAIVSGIPTWVNMST